MTNALLKCSSDSRYIEDILKGLSVRYKTEGRTFIGERDGAAKIVTLLTSENYVDLIKAHAISENGKPFLYKIRGRVKVTIGETSVPDCIGIFVRDFPETDYEEVSPESLLNASAKLLKYADETLECQKRTYLAIIRSLCGI